MELMASSLKDIMIEPQRASAVPCFESVKKYAMTNGSIGCSLSGSGPSIFALCKTGDAAKIAAGMEQECRNAGYECQSWISPLDAPGAQVEHAE
jgi:homoserine kinase